MAFAGAKVAMTLPDMVLLWILTDIPQIPNICEKSIYFPVSHSLFVLNHSNSIDSKFKVNLLICTYIYNNHSAEFQNCSITKAVHWSRSTVPNIHAYIIVTCVFSKLSFQGSKDLENHHNLFTSVLPPHVLGSTFQIDNGICFCVLTAGVWANFGINWDFLQ